MTMPVMLADAEGTIRWQNAASIALVGDRRGQPGVEIVAPEYVHEVQAAFVRKTLGIDVAREAELIVLTPDGRRRRVRSSTVALRDGDERVVGVMGVCAVHPEAQPNSTNTELTPRQHETLRLLAQGLSTEEIAAGLGVTRETARNYIRRLLRSLGAHSRLEAVVRGREHGLV